jgi:hypothetical protein
VRAVAGSDHAVEVVDLPLLGVLDAGPAGGTDRGAPTPFWAITAADGRDIHRFETTDPLEAIREYEQHPTVQSAARQLRRIGLRRLGETELTFTTGQRVRHVASDRTGTVEAPRTPLVGLAGRIHNDGVRVSMDRAAP